MYAVTGEPEDDGEISCQKLDLEYITLLGSKTCEVDLFEKHH